MARPEAVQEGTSQNLIFSAWCPAKLLIYLVVRCAGVRFFGVLRSPQENKPFFTLMPCGVALAPTVLILKLAHSLQAGSDDAYWDFTTVVVPVFPALCRWLLPCAAGRCCAPWLVKLHAQRAQVGGLSITAAHAAVLCWERSPRSDLCTTR